MPTVLLWLVNKGEAAQRHRDLDEPASSRRLAAAKMTDLRIRRTNGVFQWTSDYAILSCMTFGVFVIFGLGVVNFALHAAVLKSGHPMVEEMGAFFRALGGRLSLVAEFAVLLVAMLLAANGWSTLVWAYAGYSALNGVSAWAILTRRI